MKFKLFYVHFIECYERYLSKKSDFFYLGLIKGSFFMLRLYYLRYYLRLILEGRIPGKRIQDDRDGTSWTILRSGRN